jgi:4-amino-4-deoxy-L-arabinose transferase-like glycosyltransferase
MSHQVYAVQPLYRSRILSGTGMAPLEEDIRPAVPRQTLLSWTRRLAAIACLALAVFAPGLADRSFVDEYAYITQSFYADLFRDGQLNHRLWLDYFAYDLQPLPKYLIGMALRSAALPMPTPADAAAWYRNYQEFGSPATLIAARLPFVALGALGCAAICACGVLVKGWKAGVIAAIFLIANPLYRLHAHRAMSDVPCEAFLMAALTLFLWSWRRTWCRGPGMLAVLLPALAGLAAGLALLCKFNAFLGLMIIVLWCGIAWLAPSLSLSRKFAVSAGAFGTILVALATSVALNPYLTAEPTGSLSPEARQLSNAGIWNRFRFQVKHRMLMSHAQQKEMGHNALFDFPDKAKVTLVQGFGRFGPLGPSSSDSTKRFDAGQDRGIVVWLPLVLLGLAELVRLARRQFGAGQPPTAVALLLWAALAWVVVAAYLPMAWDRYLLPIQSGNALLAAVGASAIWDSLARRGPLGTAGN